MNTVYLLLGGNMDDPKKQLKLAAVHIGQHIGTIKATSSIWQTAAWGKTDQPDFLNQALAVETKLEPQELLAEILRIEESMGRKRKEKNDPRIIDIDMLIYEDKVIKQEALTVPHPFLSVRRFALEPLNEIAPQLIHPEEGKSIAQLLASCPDSLPVKKI
jgi:2-amino-4-hydroxy-6-hydroxymethyldihydropteridine diphosphokinase